MMMMFRSEVLNKLGLTISRIMAGEFVSATSIHLLYGSLSAVIAMGIGWVRYGSSDNEEDEEIWREMLAFGVRVGTGDLGATPIIGEGVNALSSAITGDCHYNRALCEMFFSPQDLYRHSKRIVTGQKGNKEMTAHDYISSTQGIFRALRAPCEISLYATLEAHY